jgi:hypothetical protein
VAVLHVRPSVRRRFHVRWHGAEYESRRLTVLDDGKTVEAADESVADRLGQRGPTACAPQAAVNEECQFGVKADDLVEEVDCDALGGLGQPPLASLAQLAGDLYVCHDSQAADRQQGAADEKKGNSPADVATSKRVSREA